MCCSLGQILHDAECVSQHQPLPALPHTALPCSQGTGKSATIRSLLGQEQPAGYRETSRVRQPSITCWGRAGLPRLPARWPTSDGCHALTECRKLPLLLLSAVSKRSAPLASTAAGLLTRHTLDICACSCSAAGGGDSRPGARHWYPCDLHRHPRPGALCGCAELTVPPAKQAALAPGTPLRHACPALAAASGCGSCPGRCRWLSSLPSTLPNPPNPAAPLPPGAIGANLRKLHAAKRAFNKYKPQAVLYVDRLDAGRRDLADLNVSWERCGCGMHDVHHGPHLRWP